MSCVFMILTSSPPPLGGVFLIFHCLFVCLFVFIVCKYTRTLPQRESKVYSQLSLKLQITHYTEHLLGKITSVCGRD